MKTIKLLTIICCLTTLSYSQTVFEKTYGGSSVDSGRDMVVCSNGDYLLVGVSSSYSAAGDSDVYVARISPTGSKLWSKTYGGSGAEVPWNISIVSDGNYIIAGTSFNGSNQEDIYLLKITGNGDKLWDKTYGGAGIDGGKEAVETSDGGFIVSGYVEPTPGAQNYKCTLIKTDKDGNQQWVKQYVSTEHIYFGGGASVKQTSDGGYIFFGQTHGADWQNTDYYLLKTDASGNEVWSKIFNDPNLQRGQFVWANADGTFITIGDQETGSAGGYDVEVIKFDSGGNKIWSQMIGGDDKDIGKRIRPTSDGGYIAAGNTRSFNLINPDFYVIKLDKTGKVLWTRNYGGTDHEHCYTAIELNDGSFVAMGHTRTVSNSIDVMLIRDTVSIATPTAVASLGESMINVFPNPAQSVINITGLTNYKTTQIHLNDILGKTILIKELISSSDTEIYFGKLSPGIYNLAIYSDAGVINKKVSIE